MSNKTNYPNPLLRGGPAHKHYDRDNTRTTPLSAGETFTGAWQLNTSKDVMVTCSSGSDIIIELDISNDGGTTFSTESVPIDASDNEIIIRRKGPRSFRVRVINSTVSDQNSLEVYTYYGDFGTLAEDDKVMQGTGSGTSDDPFLGHTELPVTDDILYDILRELRKVNFYLQIMTDTDIKDMEI